MIYILIDPGEFCLEQFYVTFSIEDLYSTIKKIYQEEIENCKNTADLKAWTRLRDGILNTLRHWENWSEGKHELNFDGRTLLLIITQKSIGYMYE